MIGRRQVKAAVVLVAMLGSVGAISNGVSAQTASCFGEDATIVAVQGEITRGTSGDDVIIGTSGPDEIRGRGGNDRICSRGGADVVYGNGGRDLIAGGSGGDTIYGGSKADRIIGGKGHDRLYGKSGKDVIRGKAGNDRIWGGKGDDTLRGNGGADTIRGGGGTNDCLGGAGTDSLSNCGGATAVTCPTTPSEGATNLTTAPVSGFNLGDSITLCGVGEAGMCTTNALQILASDSHTSDPSVVLGTIPGRLSPATDCSFEAELATPAASTMTEAFGGYSLQVVVYDEAADDLYGQMVFFCDPTCRPIYSEG